MLADIIPGHINSGLFLDSDTVVTGSLAGLANLKFIDSDDEDLKSGKYIFAVREIPEQNDGNSKRISKMGFVTDRYFNAGVLMVNLENWRKDNVSTGLIQMASKYMSELVFWDQDVLNMYFAKPMGRAGFKIQCLKYDLEKEKTAVNRSFLQAYQSHGII